MFHKLLKYFTHSVFISTRGTSNFRRTSLWAYFDAWWLSPFSLWLSPTLLQRTPQDLGCIVGRPASLGGFGLWKSRAQQIGVIFLKYYICESMPWGQLFEINGNNARNATHYLILDHLMMESKRSLSWARNFPIISLNKALFQCWLPDYWSWYVKLTEHSHSDKNDYRTSLLDVFIFVVRLLRLNPL